MSLIESPARETSAAPSNGAAPRLFTALELGEWLGSALDAHEVRYCQWTGQCHDDRWLAGDGDLDLLVDRAEFGTFASTVARAGFKPAVAAAGSDVPGAMTFLAQPADLGRLIQLHVHTRLIIGRPSIGAFHLPIEKAVLDSAIPGRMLRESDPGFALLLFVLRMTLRHDFRDQLASTEPEWLVVRQDEFAALTSRVSPSAARTLGRTHLPELGPELFDRCAASLLLGTPRRERWAARRALERRLAGYRMPALRGVMRRAAGAVGRRIGIGQRAGGRYLASGGAVIALIGTDGSGKSTVARALTAGFQNQLSAVHAHLGRPPRSIGTLLAGAVLKAARRLASAWPRGRSPALVRVLELARSVATARDRYRLVRRLRQQAEGGSLVICERFPLRPCYALAGPTTDYDGELARSSVGRWLRRREIEYYDALGVPDTVVILEVDRETAVRRKQDEPADYVRRRAELFQSADWSGQDVVVIDAGQSIREVLAATRERIWSAL